MNKIQQPRVVTVDVDDTLLMWDYHDIPHNEDELITFEDSYGQWKLLPHKKHIEFIKNLKHQGYGIVVWSAAGNDWAEEAVKMLGIEYLVDGCMSKPEFAIDDLLRANRIIKSVLWVDPKTGEFKRSE